MNDLFGNSDPVDGTMQQVDRSLIKISNNHYIVPDPRNRHMPVASIVRLIYQGIFRGYECYRRLPNRAQDICATATDIRDFLDGNRGTLLP